MKLDPEMLLSFHAAIRAEDIASIQALCEQVRNEYPETQTMTDEEVQRVLLRQVGALLQCT